jgi:sulfite reductase beta subunit-like hemoprotein
MWRFKCANGKFTLKQWKVLNDQVREYWDGSKDHWKPNGCYSLTTRQNVQLFGIRLENLPRHWKALRDAGELATTLCSALIHLIERSRALVVKP